MKIDPSEPGASEPASPTLDRYVRASRRSDASDAAIRRISDNLATAGVFARGSSPRGAATSWKLYSKIGIGLAVLAGGWGSWRVLHAPPTSPTPEATGTHLEAKAITADDSKTTPPSEPRDTPPNADLPKAAISVDALPSVAQPPSHAPISAPPARAIAPVAIAPAAIAPAAVATAKASENVASDPAPTPRELELVQRAQAMLASDPERALAITREQARLYPAGEYIQEREVFAVEALARLGRREEAQRRASALLQRFPRTPYVSRLEIALGGHLPAPASTASSADVAP